MLVIDDFFFTDNVCLKIAVDGSQHLTDALFSPVAHSQANVSSAVLPGCGPEIQTCTAPANEDIIIVASGVSGARTQACSSVSTVVSSLSAPHCLIDAKDDHFHHLFHHLW